MQALITLELIDDNLMPTETLEILRRVPEPEFKEKLAAWIESVYANILNFADPNDDETAIRDAFRGCKPVGQQHRMVSLFMGLCRAAGLRKDEQPVPKKRSRTSPPTPRKTKRKSAQTAKTQSDLHPAVAGLMKSLPKSGTWTAEEREKFLKTFTAVLDFTVYVVAKKAEEKDDAEEKL